MSWLTNLVRPKLRALVDKKDVPDNLWDKCPGCGQMIFHRDLAAADNVCPHCNHHMRIKVKKRLELLFDNGEYKTVKVPPAIVDPLKFRDRKRYSERMKDARAKLDAKSDQDDAIIVAYGQVMGVDTVISIMDFDFMGGSMGLAVGEGLVIGAQTAVSKKMPYIVITSSGGARMQEGILSLMQMPRSTIAVEMVKEAGLPYIVLLTDPTTGGVSASFAMLGDIALAEPGALIGFAGQRVIQETIRQELPKGFQRAEYLLEHGMVDRVASRKDLKKEVAVILDLLVNPKKSKLAKNENK
jgi:acetyl-CoA carboxylase carboxyl transferase subunit beta